MDDAEILERLLELADEAGFEVRIAGRGAIGADDLPLSSGVCKVRGKLWVVLSGQEPPEVQIAVIALALREHAGGILEGRHLPPALREKIHPGGADDLLFG
jgi:hypothetical protein